MHTTVLYRPRTIRTTQSKAYELAKRMYVTVHDLPFLEQLLVKSASPNEKSAMDALCSRVRRLESEKALVYLQFEQRQLLLAAAGESH